MRYNLNFTKPKKIIVIVLLWMSFPILSCFAEDGCNSDEMHKMDAAEELLFKFIKERMFFANGAKLLTKESYDCKVCKLIKELPVNSLTLKLVEQLAELMGAELLLFQKTHKKEYSELHKLIDSKMKLFESQINLDIEHLDNLRSIKSFCKPFEDILENTLIYWTFLEEGATDLRELQLAGKVGADITEAESKILQELILENALKKHKIFFEENKDFFEKIEEFANSGCGFEFEEISKTCTEVQGKEFCLDDKNIKQIKNFLEVMSYDRQKLEDSASISLKLIKEFVHDEFIEADSAFIRTLLEEKMLPLFLNDRWKVQIKALSYIPLFIKKGLLNPILVAEVNLVEKIIPFLNHVQSKVQDEALRCLYSLTEKDLIDAELVKQSNLMASMELLLMNQDSEVQMHALRCLDLLSKKDLINVGLLKKFNIVAKMEALFMHTQWEVAAINLVCLQHFAEKDLIDATLLAELKLENNGALLFKHSEWEVQKFTLYCLSAFLEKGLIDAALMTKLNLAEKIEGFITHSEWIVQGNALYCLQMAAENDFIDEAFIAKTNIMTQLEHLCLHSRWEVQANALNCLQLFAERDLIDADWIGQSNIVEKLADIISNCHEDQYEVYQPAILSLKVFLEKKLIDVSLLKNLLSEGIISFLTRPKSEL